MHALQRLLENMDDDELSIQSYSGRGMNGMECLGVVVPSITVFFHKVLIAVLDPDFDNDDSEDITGAIANMKEDSMGRNDIVYFPNIKYQEP